MSVKMFLLLAACSVAAGCDRGCSIAPASAEARDYCPRPATIYYTTNGSEPIDCVRTVTPQKPLCPFPTP